MRTKLALEAFILVVGLSIALASAAEKLPRFLANTNYDEARRNLIALGWEPVAQSPTFCEGKRCGLKRCIGGFEHRCRAYPETLICRGTGRASCEFLWRRGETLIVVHTFGELDPPIVDSVRCRVNCP